MRLKPDTFLTLFRFSGFFPLHFIAFREKIILSFLTLRLTLRYW